ncbi:hypothetical protein ACFL35_00505 [Candidatus Riflebacteria bacterium]
MEQKQKKPDKKVKKQRTVEELLAGIEGRLMALNDIMDIEGACYLLNISRPIFLKYVFPEVKFKRIGDRSNKKKTKIIFTKKDLLAFIESEQEMKGEKRGGFWEDLPPVEEAKKEEEEEVKEKKK